jgi:ElaB/YqjD/DUF883 family membrane-anchored ribosome-binding protein
MNIASTLRNSTNSKPSEFAAKLVELRTLLAEIAQSAPSAASESFDELKHKAAALCDNCEEKVSDVTHTVVKTVKEHPAQVALAAVGAGLLAWWLLSRNCSNSK